MVTIFRKAFYLIVYVPFYAVLKLMGSLPRETSLKVGEAIGRIGYYIVGGRRRIARANVNLIYGDSLPEKAKEKIVRESFVTLGRLLADFSFFPRFNKGNIGSHVEYSGFENYSRAIEQDKGLIYLCGHFGSWELMAFAHAVYGNPLCFVVRPADNPYIESLLLRYRELSGNRVISKWDATKASLVSLKKGEAIGILLDQYVSADRGVVVPFLGKETGTSTITAALALRTDAPVVPVFLLWDRTKRKHILRFDPSVEIKRNGDSTINIAENTRRFNDILGDAIRKDPSLWLWCHRRWR